MVSEYFPSDGRDRLHPETLLTTTEAAKLMNVTERTIRNWCNSGAVPCFRVGGSGHRRIRAGDLYSYRLHDNRSDLAAAAPPERVISGWAHVSDGWGGWRPPNWAGADHVAALRRDAGVLGEALETVMRACEQRLALLDLEPAATRPGGGETAGETGRFGGGVDRLDDWDDEPGGADRRAEARQVSVQHTTEVGDTGHESAVSSRSSSDAVVAWLNRRDRATELIDELASSLGVTVGHDVG